MVYTSCQQLSADSVPEREWYPPKSAAKVVIMIGRKRAGKPGKSHPGASLLLALRFKREVDIMIASSHDADEQIIPIRRRPSSVGQSGSAKTRQHRRMVVWRDGNRMDVALVEHARTCRR